MPLAQSWSAGAYCAWLSVGFLAGNGRLSVCQSRTPGAAFPGSPGLRPVCLLIADRRGLGSHRCWRVCSFGAGAGSLAVQDAGHPDPGVLHARGADGVHGDRLVMHVGGGWGASRSGAGFDERTRLRLSRISIARCAGRVPLLRVCVEPSRHGQCTVPWEHAPWTNVPARGTFGPAAGKMLSTSRNSNRGGRPVDPETGRARPPGNRG